MWDKRGFVSLFFLAWFLILSAWTSLGYLQINAEIEVAEQLEAGQRQELRLIPIFRWIRCRAITGAAAAAGSDPGPNALPSPAG